MLKRFFKSNPESAAAKDRVKGWVRENLGLAEDATVSVNEIECGDPACPGGVETVVLVRLRASVTSALKLPGPASTVTREALAAALASLQGR